jgi:NADH pyrophosphatase NudC (nudix superfamily)
MIHDPHLVVAILTCGVGCAMALAGVQKSALEWRRRHRVCPSCGRALETRVCRTCAG